MRRTDRARLLTGFAIAGFLLALAAGTPVPAMVAALLAAIVAGARAQSEAVTIGRALPDEVTAHEPFEAILHWSARDPARIAAFESRIVGDHTVESVIPGAGSTTTRVHPNQAGAIAFTGVDLEARDRHDLVRAEWTLPLPATLRVGPAASMVALGRRVGRRAKVARRSRRTLAAEREPEVDRLREHRPGDLLRDIDWKASARRTALVSREWIRAPHSTVTILLDAGSTMREGALVPKMRTAVDAAIATLAAAMSAGLPIGLVAWSEDGIETTARPGTTRASMQAALESLSRISPTPRRPSVAGVPINAPHVDEHERAFLRAADHHGRGGAPIELALAYVMRTQRQPGWIVCIVDAEERPGLVALLVRRLQARGHRVTIIAPKNGAHHLRLHDAAPSDHARLARWLHERAVARAECRRRKAQFLPLAPNVSALEVSEVMTFA